MVDIKRMEQESQQLVELAITLSELMKEDETVKKEIAELEGGNAGGVLEAEGYHRLWKVAKTKQEHLDRKILSVRSRMGKIMSALDACFAEIASPAQKRV